MKLFLICACCLVLAACHTKEQADLIIHDARVYTVDSAFSIAGAIAIKDGKILAVGSDSVVMEGYTASQIIDAGGKPVYPGFIDAHAHFLEYGKSLFTVNLYGCTSFSEVVSRVKTFALANPDLPWILGRGWDQNKFPGKAFPDNDSLNQAFPHTPIALERIDGHAMIANTTALDLSGVRAGLTLTGGTVETRNGRLTGILVDNAVRLVTAHFPGTTSADYAKWLLAGQQRCFAQGLTTLTDCGLNTSDINHIDSLQRSGQLKMRLYIMLSDNKANLDYWLPKGPYKTDRLSVRSVKAYADGALGSRGACLLQPYTDRPGWNGFLLSPIAHYDSLARLLIHTDFQLCTHAIGDSANRVILTVYNKYLGGKNDRRWRIEHAQIVDSADMALFAKGSIVPSVQPTHATSDMYWAAERLGPARMTTAYAYHPLLTENGWLPLGTDFPVEDISPFKTFLAAVFRVDAQGFPQGGFQMTGALSREEALRGMTIWAARADFMEGEVGSLEPGKRADFILLDKDLMEVGWQDVLHTKVLGTWSGGERVYGQ